MKSFIKYTVGFMGIGLILILAMWIITDSKHPSYEELLVKFQLISEGMEKEKVIAILGDPLSIIEPRRSGEGCEEHLYRTDDNSTSCFRISYDEKGEVWLIFIPINGQ